MNLQKIQKLNLIKRNIAWWNGGISISQKLGYYFNMIICFARIIITGKKQIKYLGYNLHFDNTTTPLSIQYYPHEISKKILANISKTKVKRILDIGGNIGQFSLTFSELTNHSVKIDILEPNPKVYSILSENVKERKNLNCFNVGIGDTKLNKMFFEPGRSAIGSVLKQNAGNINNLQKVDVKLTNNIPSLTGTSKYDIIKIDVEGYEYDVIKHVTNLKTKYLFIEVSGLGRHKTYNHSDLLSLIQKTFGNFDILNISQASSKSNQFDLLLAFK